MNQLTWMVKYHKAEIIENVLHLLWIIGILILFFFFLFEAVSNEQDRREGQKSDPKWRHERALLEAGK